MFNKLKFNNLITSSKSKIQRARVQTFTKLVHKIRKLKAHLEKQPNDSTKIKLRKTVMMMETLKKLKHAELMKGVLLIEKPSALISSGRANPEELTLAMFSLNKISKELIETFRKEMNLENAGSWREQLKSLTSKRKEKIERTERKRRKRAEYKEKKMLAIKQVERVDNNIENAKAGNLMDTSIISSTGIWQVEDYSTNTQSENSKYKQMSRKVEYKKISNQRKIVNTGATKGMDQNDSVNNVLENENCCNQPLVLQKEAKEINNSHESLTKDTLPIENIRIVDIKRNIESSVETQINLVQMPTEPDNGKLEEFVADPFFLTETGENYLSTAVISKNTVKSTPVQGKLFTRSENLELGQDKFKETKRFAENQVRSLPKENKRGNNDLHPSWAAKQKMKLSATSFAGKRTKFGSDDEEADNQFTKVAKSHQSNTEVLHPSWAAKKKMKPIIEDFKGKKIIFDNDD